MAIRPGDTVSIQINPSVQLSQYTYLKPSARITRVIGEDVEASLTELEVDLRKMVVRTAALELNLLNDLTEAVSSGDLNNYIEKELANVPQVTTERKPESGVGPQPRKAGPQPRRRQG